MSATKTKPTRASVKDYIAGRASEEQKIACQVLMRIFKKLTRHQPRMWGPSIVGYGSCRYSYPSGRSGEMPLAAFAIRGRELVVYLDCEGAEQRALLSRLGKHRKGKSCLYFKRLADIDASALERLVAVSIARTTQRYGGGGTGQAFSSA